MDRRNFLATAGSALGLSVAGCLGSADDRSDIDGGNGDDSEGNGTGNGTDSEAESHHLYLVNLDDEIRRVELAVVRQGDDDPAIEGTYDVPGERGGEFREVAAWEETYEVTASLETGVSETFCWRVDRCPGPEEAGAEAAELPGGSRNGSVRIEPGAEELSFVTDSCDEIVAGTEAPVGPADQFEAEGAD